MSVSLLAALRTRTADATSLLAALRTRAADATGTSEPCVIVCVSDTHGMHRTLNVPEGDVLLHAGDFTRFGNQADAVDFNEWLGTLSHPHKVVVLGNHEANAPWVEGVQSVLSNAHVLVDRGLDLSCRGGTVRLWGTAFYWPVETKHFAPPYGLIPEGTDILACHGPAAGYADGGMGCTYLLEHVERVRPQAVVCGHIHEAHGVCAGRGLLADVTTFVNAANAGGRGAKRHSRTLGWKPVVLEVWARQEERSALPLASQSAEPG